MRGRLLPAMVVVLGLLGAACATDDPALAPTPAPTGGEQTLGEVRLTECVIDRGDVPPAEATGRDFQTIQPGVLTVGSDTAFPPFESIENGEAVGFDMDIIREVAKRLGLRAEIQSAPFDTIFQALASGKFDVVISAVTIKADRKQTVDFTDPYFTADQSLTVTADSDVRGVDDLEEGTVGVQDGTTGQDCANNALKAKGRIQEVRAYTQAPDAFTDLSAGRIDAVLIDLPTAKQIVEQREGLEVVQRILTDEEYGVAVRKEQPNLRVRINEALAAMKDDGTYAEIYREWFKTDPPA